ncbi:SMI1/KNR4 family protein [Bartonella sp. 220]|uniref:SMI1/KNR4 family protein n=1 Tax=Bartonella sp. 220B TaxID=2967260 RepID=UPI0022A95602|nr:SMI1/KNR4 family protein [Bartonella sp. 220B]MCZ2159229.1 SMI1/KNR4 family protein [Bartonella sp. 220B]
MKTYTLADVTVLIDKVNKYDDDIIHFRTEDNAVDDLVIEKAEKALGLQFTSSYKAFLKHYKGGDIGGDEIYSLYEHPIGVSVNDIVHQNLNYYRKHGFATSEQLVVSSTDFGETFYFDYTQFRDGECPLYVMLPSEDCEYYASNFYEFLCKRIKESVGEEIPDGDQPIEKIEKVPTPQPIPFYKRFWKKLWKR